MRDAARGWWPFGDQHEEERLSALLDDELPEPQALEVTRHLADCERCLTELQAIREARGALRGLPDVQPPDDLYGEVLARPPDVAARDPAGALTRIWAATLVSLGLLAAAAFLAGSDDQGTVSPPVDVFVVDHVVRMEGGPVITPVELGR